MFSQRLSPLPLVIINDQVCQRNRRKDKTSPGQHIAAEQEHGFLKHALILVLLGFPPVHGFPCQLISTTASTNIYKYLQYILFLGKLSVKISLGDVV
jgi:hypothetical protein